MPDDKLSDADAIPGGGLMSIFTVLVTTRLCYDFAIGVAGNAYNCRLRRLPCSDRTRPLRPTRVERRRNLMPVAALGTSSHQSVSCAPSPFRDGELRLRLQPVCRTARYIPPAPDRCCRRARADRSPRTPSGDGYPAGRPRTAW